MGKRIKKLLESRAALVEHMEELTNICETEVRAMTDAESVEFDRLEKEIQSIDHTIERIQRAENIDNPGVEHADSENVEQNAENRAQAEERAFDAYLRAEGTRTDTNMTAGANGAVIPSTIINKIIDKVKDISPVFSMATRYNIGGNISIPYVDASASTITVAYSDDFTELTGTAENLKAINLSGYLAGALTKVGKKLLTNSQFDLTGFIVGKMAEAIAAWIDNELLNGTSGKIAGLSGVTQTVTAKSATAITADELIDTQEAIPDAYQGNACWVMNRTTRAAIRKLKDADGNYLLNRDLSTKWGYTLLGKPVYCSDAMTATLSTGKTALYYGDFSGLAVKVSEGAEVQILREKYATQHAIGVVAWLEIDAKVENAQKIARLKMA